jgi:hypothetical protein
MMADPRRLAWGACLAMAVVATSAFAGVRVVGPAPASEPRAGLEYGPWISASEPTRTAGDVFDRGISAGMTVTEMQTPMIGVGADIAYVRYPSPIVGASWDALFSSVGSAPVSGTKFTMTSLQLSGHFKVSPLPGHRVEPWLQAGMGVSRANRKLEVPVVQLQAAGWQAYQATSNDITYQPLFETRVGLDFKTSEGMKIGVHASYQWQLFSNETSPFTALSIGGHVLFGRR